MISTWTTSSRFSRTGVDVGSCRARADVFSQLCWRHRCPAGTQGLYVAVGAFAPPSYAGHEDVSVEWSSSLSTFVKVPRSKSSSHHCAVVLASGYLRARVIAGSLLGVDR